MDCIYLLCGYDGNETSSVGAKVKIYGMYPNCNYNRLEDRLARYDRDDKYKVYRSYPFIYWVLKVPVREFENGFSLSEMDRQ